MVLPIADRHLGYAKSVAEKLRSAGVRFEIDSRSEKINYKIREAQLQKVPYMLVVGDREEADGKVALRARKAGDLGSSPVDEVVSRIQQAIETRSLGE
jgi:threonyl-tRNA synthetase